MAKERGSFVGEFGASYFNQRGLCDATLPKLLLAGLVIFISYLYITEIIVRCLGLLDYFGCVNVTK